MNFHIQKKLVSSSEEEDPDYSASSEGEYAVKTKMIKKAPKKNSEKPKKVENKV